MSIYRSFKKSSTCMFSSFFKWNILLDIILNIWIFYNLKNYYFISLFYLLHINCNQIFCPFFHCPTIWNFDLSCIYFSISDFTIPWMNAFAHSNRLKIYLTVTHKRKLLLIICYYWTFIQSSWDRYCLRFNYTVFQT